MYVPIVLDLFDEARQRLLQTTVYVPGSGRRSPLVAFGHGMWGHPRKFTWLFNRWADAGFVVAAPAFPRTSKEDAQQHLMNDVVNQPADLTFVLDQVVARGFGDGGQIGIGGFSLGAETALATGLHPDYADERVRAVVSIAGALFHSDFAAGALRPLPLLVIHGAEDTKRDRLREALKTYEAAGGPKQLATIEGAGHGICQDDDPRPYVAHVAELTANFWRRYLRE